MEERNAKYIAMACAAKQLVGPPEKLARRACTDSRQAQADDVFIALPGERFDGHVFLEEVVRKGVKVVVVQEGKAVPDLGDCAIVVVKDTRQALCQLAARYR